MISDAARTVSNRTVCGLLLHAPIPLSFVGMLTMLAFSSLAESGVPFAVVGDRVKELASGPRWVSLSSVRKFISTLFSKRRHLCSRVAAGSAD
jgi:hypothetical protein